MQLAEIKNIVRVRIGTVELRDDNIVELNIDDDVLLDVDDIVNINTEINNFTKGKRHLVLVITGERNGNTNEARKLSLKLLKDENYALAEALVVNSLPTRLAAKFFFKAFKPKFPYKLFKSKKKAEDWLRTFL